MAGKGGKPKQRGKVATRSAAARALDVARHKEVNTKRPASSTKKSKTPMSDMISDGAADRRFI